MSTESAPLVLVMPHGSFGQNTVLLIDEASRAAIVIDPGEEHARILAAIRHRELQVQGIWLTHGHIDHIWGTDAVRGATGAEAWLHPADRAWYDRFADQCGQFGFAPTAPLAAPDHDLVAGQLLMLGPWQFEVRHVPGHSPGHVAFVGHGLCISGDVLFAGSIGRTDLAGGDHAQLIASIRSQLLPLPDETRVLTGHGPETTIGKERRSNPFLR
jgi:glyoxylase-like metal-dependent hydrolase (beta-lactamase superfamily II)